MTVPHALITTSFVYDIDTDSLAVGGVNFANGSFRKFDGQVWPGVHNMGGGVFTVTFPPPPAPAVAPRPAPSPASAPHLASAEPPKEAA